MNNNSFGLAPADQVVAVGSLAPGGSGSAQVAMTHNPTKLAQGGPSSMRLQVRMHGQRWCAAAVAWRCNLCARHVGGVG